MPTNFITQIPSLFTNTVTIKRRFTTSNSSCTSLILNNFIDNICHSISYIFKSTFSFLNAIC
ncbi:unnamed protein product [Meloidogyne enterolobii]|uniref:Uncharacterized protein n=1 Tax=Meloidogyne enterolobii TaxID=390850 RepID=A0ACB0YBE0_MELEN